MSLGTADTVLALDRFQNTADRRTCQANPNHGTLFPHKSAAYFTCGRGGCDYAEPVSADTIKQALELR